MKKTKQTLNLKRICTEINVAVTQALKARCSHKFTMDMLEFSNTLEPIAKGYNDERKKIREDLKELFLKEHDWEMPFSETEDDYVSLSREERELIHEFNEKFDERMKELDAVEKEVEVMVWKVSEIEEERKTSEKRYKDQGFAPTGMWYKLMGALIEPVNEKKKGASSVKRKVAEKE